MISNSKSYDDEYAQISLSMDWENPEAYIEDLRRIAHSNHKEAMNLLAIVLGEVDSDRYRDEIVSLLERAHELGSPVAAETLSIQYKQWKEPLLSKYWLRKAAK